MASTASNPRLVVGVDFGTTFSGFSYVGIPTNYTRRDLNPEPKVVNFQNTEQLKIPTQLCYCSSNCQDASFSSPGGPPVSYTWGSKTNGCQRRPYMYFKLQLGHGSLSSADMAGRRIGTCVDNSGEPANHLASSTDLFIHYLSAMREEFMDCIVEEYSNRHRKEDFRIDWVFTIPAFFDPTLIAELVDEYIPRAGFNDPVTSSITHILEPEAAAVRVLSQSLLSPTSLGRTLNLKGGDKILVCDGGGGTTDLFAFEIITMEMERLVPHIKMKPLAEPFADTIGAMDINKAFESYLEKVFDTALQQYPALNTGGMREHIDSDKTQACLAFETYKLQFTSSGDRQMMRPINLPSLDGLTLQHMGLEDGVLQLNDELMRQFFNKVMLRVIKLLEKQLLHLEQSRHTVGAIILVGGLGASPYIQQILKAWASRRRPTPIQIVPPLNSKEAISAIMCGATQHGIQKIMLERPTTTQLVPTRSYGFIIDEVYEATRHDSYDYVDPCTEQKMAKNQIRWVIKKGIPLNMSESYPGEAVAETTTPFRLNHKPDKHVLPEEEYNYTVVMSREYDPADLPIKYSPHDAKIETLVRMEMDCGPYDNLKPCFREFWRETPSSKRKFFGKKGVTYWEGEIQLSIHISSGERIYATTCVKGAKLRSVEFNSFEKRFRRRLRWFKRTRA